MVFIPRRGSSGCLKINGTCGEGAPSPIMPREPPFPATSSRTPGSELSLSGARERLSLFCSVCRGAQATATEAESYVGSERGSSAGREMKGKSTPEMNR